MISGCTSASHLFEEISYELAVVDSFAFTARITITLALMRVNHIILLINTCVKFRQFLNNNHTLDVDVISNSFSSQ